MNPKPEMKRVPLKQSLTEYGDREPEPVYIPMHKRKTQEWARKVFFS